MKKLTLTLGEADIGNMMLGGEVILSTDDLEIVVKYNEHYSYSDVEVEE